MRIANVAPLWLCLTAGAALAQSAPAASTSTTNDQSGESSPSHAELVAQYPGRIADRPRAIGAGLFEAAWDGDWQFNANQEFGELPDVRYGVTDQLEVTLLGARYVIAEDAAYIPGLAIRAQLHDLAYQGHGGTNLTYPLLRPGVFLELRDRLPFHLAVNGLLGYQMDIEGNRGADGTPLQSGQQIAAPVAPLELELQWSPIALFSLDVTGGYLVDTSTPSYSGPNQSDGVLTVAAVLNTNRFDVKVFYTNNWFGNPTLGYVPELGVGAAVRL